MPAPAADIVGVVAGVGEVPLLRLPHDGAMPSEDATARAFSNGSEENLLYSGSPEAFPEQIAAKQFVVDRTTSVPTI